jgi:hypothetical protein
MKRIYLLFIITAIIGFALISSAHAWPFYSKPEFRGRIIDAETKEPIEGAVIVVLYMKWEFGGPGGGSTVPMDAKETLTDTNGDFYFPSYGTMIGPLSRERVAEFIIYKPGYKSITYINGEKIPDEIYLGIEKDMIGKEGEIKHIDRYGNLETWKGPLGVVELEKPKTREERRETRPSKSGFKEDALPIFFKILEDEYHYLYK